MGIPRSSSSSPSELIRNARPQAPLAQWGGNSGGPAMALEVTLIRRHQFLAPTPDFWPVVMEWGPRIFIFKAPWWSWGTSRCKHRIPRGEMFTVRVFNSLMDVWNWQLHPSLNDDLFWLAKWPWASSSPASSSSFVELITHFQVVKIKQ